MKSLGEILSPFKSENIIEWFLDLVTLWHETGPIEPEDRYTPKGMFQWVHYHNFKLWHLEDEARRDDVNDTHIAKSKRSIDRHNQQRNDAIEKIDIWLDNVFQTAEIIPGEQVAMNSETVGSIIDRLSILTLKIYHMGEQIERKDVDKEHREQAKYRLTLLREQLLDLGKALDHLLLDLRQAKKRHKVYRQYKMYNDPMWNPAIYRNK